MLRANYFLRLFCYPTEDPEKVKKLLEILGIEDYTVQQVEEAFGLPMYIFSASSSSGKKVKELLKKILELAEDKQAFLERLKDFYDEKGGACYLRLDKQELFKYRKAKLVSHGDVVHIKIKFVSPRKLEEFLQQVLQD
ncbi:MAG: hypothetical protein GXO42_02975 [bacterium]|nr:hypothetical protein [bacterium]